MDVPAAPRLHLDILTLFPEMFTYLQQSIVGRAHRAGLVTSAIHDMRDQATNRHRTVDDRPFGGGPGMVLKADIVHAALEALALPPGARILLMSPQGRRFDQQFAIELSQERHLVMLCGHYEGIDERVQQHMVTDEVSVGDFVLTGGELPALTIADAIVRLLPGALGKDASPFEDSFYHGLLDHPHYTRPASFMGWDVPPVLVGGNHAEVAKWRRREALRRTLERRPDLLPTAPLSADDRRYLAELGYVAGAEPAVGRRDL